MSFQKRWQAILDQSQPTNLWHSSWIVSLKNFDRILIHQEICMNIQIWNCQMPCRQRMNSEIIVKTNLFPPDLISDELKKKKKMCEGKEQYTLHMDLLGYTCNSHYNINILKSSSSLVLLWLRKGPYCKIFGAGNHIMVTGA